MESAIKRVPIEIWRKILYMATMSPFLSFAEDGKLSSGLMESMDVFPTMGHDFCRYRDETQATIERLRLVCCLWSEVLRNRLGEFAVTDFNTYYFPSKKAANNATRVDTVEILGCGYSGHLGKGCAYRQIGNCRKKTAETYTGTDIIPDKLPSNMKILSWKLPRYPATDYFLSPLESLIVLSVGGSCLPGNGSLNHMCTLVPNLSHLGLDVQGRNLHFFADPVIFPTVRYLYLRIQTRPNPEPSFFAQITCPLLQSVRILGFVSFRYEGYFLDFITRHGKSIRELDITYFADRNYGDYLAQVNSALWTVCPGITTLAVEMDRLILKGMEDPWHPRSALSGPMTLLMKGHNPAPGDFLRIIPPISRMQKLLNVEKVIYTGLWDESHFSPRIPGLKMKVEECLRLMREMDIPIIDRFDVLLVDVIQKIQSSL
ncbi:hypothetical protein CPB86DRAFT_556826 [Serendipita vermifera]|nr:hypothetical protein CPB86DRAFT_556826 [Serendipita vermifera]